MSKLAMEKATIAETLYKNGTIPVKKIAEQLDISKTTGANQQKTPKGIVKLLR